ncbi:glutamine synthetase/guanido kinase [Rozella allomycis CSF55]|uniref:Glutamine synthetase, catalytic domain-containing protein n=1 Tax=Rozella allomycis (strain CSF55) TaxID=988480 RepID=A0A075AY51_ROZAC|nr:Glutamine synthetase, catalytic domain-containing protein [Rozella allomycis CSF55]RKP18856.1 glutamine synthetase/guanido kinase [Rozella allomycis CSF55]|eukprot:EPZ33612.1 Glutamine synthetase, catalytic domain-containing protein [Rozella allomycis CSF55]
MTVQTARTEAVQEIISRPSRSVSYPKSESTSQPLPLSEFFGENVFTMAKMEKELPKPVYAEFKKQMEGGRTMTKQVADAIAHAVRVWAMNKGATHFTHWFQPQTDSTAEKHDSFLTIAYNTTSSGLEIKAIDAFSGSQLLQGEPDASSFPNGGMRATFEARGYTVWDTSSPMFVQEGPHGTKVLYIPTVFISYNGEALDEKTILLRSTEAISSAATRMLHLLGKSDVKRVFTTLGTEQEFFLVDRGLYALRPDLKICGRTMLGVVPPKHQQMEDHYFGRIPSRVLSTISEVELELWKLGVPVKTRHNEVAPAQFEMAPIFEEATIAVDHNLLTMDALHRVAHRHKLKVLFHEKPFKGVNGSGKHCNWSLCTDKGENLLDPTATPENNYQFLLFLVATLQGVYKFSGVLRAGISSASNEHRLGANEAPPGIISAFLGAQLSEVLDSIEQGRDYRPPAQHKVQTVKLGGTVLDLKIASLPAIARDLTDRNRTSPFAFTGNKFEFRAVGAKQSPSFPVSLLNAAVADGLVQVCDALEKKKGSKQVPSKEDILSVVKDFIVATKNIRFEGNGYSEEWVKEAEKRGLLNIRSAPVAFAQLLTPENKKMLTRTGVFTEDELESRYHVLIEKYTKDLLIEANTLKYMVQTNVLPAVFKYRRDLADGVTALEALKESAPEKKVLRTLSEWIEKTLTALDSLDTLVKQVNDLKEPEQQVEKASEFTQIFDKIRYIVDQMEHYVEDSIWPYPKYYELLFAA